MLIEQPWGQQKPPYGTKVNGKHELLSAGGSVWLFNEGAGATAYDGLGKYSGTLNGTATWWTGAYSGVAFTTSGLVTVSNPPNPAYPFSLAFLISYTTPSDSNLCIWEINQNSGWSLQTSRAGLGGVGVAGGLFLNVGNGAYLASKSAWNDGNSHRAVIVLPSSTITGWKLYVDGKDDTGGNNAINATPTYAGAPLYFGSRNGSLCFGGQLGFGAIFSRALSYAEIQQLYASPYCFMQPRRLWMPEVVTGGGAVYLTRRTQEGFGARVGSRKVAA